MKELEIGDFPSIESTQFVPGFSSIIMPSGFELDIMTYLKGFEQIRFDECYAMATTAMIEHIPVKFMNINQLIEAKKALARPKDLLDAEELEKIKNSK